MSVATFIPAIWYSKLLTSLKPRLVGEAFVNHDVEGEVMYGGSVKINKVADVTLRTYTGSTITYDDATTSDLTLNINLKNYAAIKIDDVDKVQARDGGQLMTKYIENMSYEIAKALDVATFTEIAGAATAANTLGDDTTPEVVTTAAQAKALLLNLKTLADEANVPDDVRRLACPPAFENLLLSDPYINIAPPTAQDSLRAGYIGKLYGIELYKTNNIPKTTGSNSQIILSHPLFTTEVNQIQELEALRDTNSFKDLVRCLSVSGRKTIMPEGVIKAVVSFTSGS